MYYKMWFHFAHSTLSMEKKNKISHEATANYTRQCILGSHTRPATACSMKSAMTLPDLQHASLIARWKSEPPHKYSIFAMLASCICIFF